MCMDKLAEYAARAEALRPRLSDEQRAALDFRETEATGARADCVTCEQFADMIYELEAGVEPGH